MTKSDATFEALLADRTKAYERIEVLEQLCRDLWVCYERGKCAYCEHYRTKYDREWCNMNLEKRMTKLGLLEGENE